MTHYARVNSDTPRARRAKRMSETEEFHLGEWLDDLWEGRYLILTCIVLFTALGALLVWRKTPVYQAESLLQLHDKKPLSSDPAFAKMEGLFAAPSDASAEVEILKSDLILGRVVKSLGMDISAEPKRLPFIGAALERGKADAPRIEIDSLQVPESHAGIVFRVSTLPGGVFRWSTLSGQVLATGKPGEMLSGDLDGATVKLAVRGLMAEPGQEFRVSRVPLAAAIESLRRSFEAAQRGSQTNVIGLSYRDAVPARCAAVLNAIVDHYTRYTMERKAEDANKARAIVENELGPLKQKLDASESRLNSFRSRYGSVDLTREGETLLAQSSALSGQISALTQKKQEALRTYRETSDVVTTIDLQIQKLEAESAQVAGRVRSLPGTQQEVVRLSRDVQINTELYTALLNNLQQLQIASSGDVGSVAVVGPATVNPVPIGPKPLVMRAFYAALGLMVGVGLTMLRQLLRQGIRDHRIIEAKLGLPVLVTIPHSRDQKKQSVAIDKNKEGLHLLASQHPDDLAVESLRSLRTTLLFALKENPNRAIMVTSPSPSVGKSFLCANLAVLLAQTGARVLLIDSDLRRGHLHRHFGMKTRQSGLSDVLAARAEWRSTVRPTEFAGLFFMSTGIIPGDAAHLLLSKHFSAMVEEAVSEYDYVLFDAPPLLPVTDATIIGSAVGTVLLMAKFGQHSLDELRTCQQRMEDHNIHLSGCIFNDIMPTGLGYGYQEYRYAYHYQYK